MCVCCVCETSIRKYGRGLWGCGRSFLPLLELEPLELSAGFLLERSVSEAQQGALVLRADFLFLHALLHHRHGELREAVLIRREHRDTAVLLDTMHTETKFSMDYGIYIVCVSVCVCAVTLLDDFSGCGSSSDCRFLSTDPLQ